MSVIMSDHQHRPTDAVPALNRQDNANTEPRNLTGLKDRCELNYVYILRSDIKRSLGALDKE